MARETFIDTSGFYALLVSGDSEHADAEAWLKSGESGMDEGSSLHSSRHAPRDETY